MNRSFMGRESLQTQTAMKQRQQMGSLKSAMKENEDELTLFLEMRRREKERNNLLLLQNSEEFDAPVGLKPGSSPIFNIASSAPAPARRNGAEDFLNSDGDKNDYDWLLTPPGTPLFPHLEMKQKTAMSQIGTPNTHPAALKSRLASSQPEPVIRSNIVSRQHNSSPALNSSTASIRRPSSSGGTGSRPGTPTGRPTLTATSKPSRSSTPTSRPTLTNPPARSSTPTSGSTARSSTPTSGSTARSSTPTARSSTPTARSSTPTARSSTPTARSSTPTARSSTPTARSSTPTARSSTPTARSSTPTARSSTPTVRSSTPTARSSTPTTRPSIPASKPTSRAATPTRRPSMPSTFSNLSAAPVKPSSSSVSKATSTSTPSRPTLAPTTKPGPTTSKNPLPARGISPTVKSKPWKPIEMPGYSLDAPSNLRTSVLPDRPLSASRGRPGAPSPQSSSVESGPSGRPRRQSCSPSRGRPPNGIAHMSGSSVPAANRHPQINDNVSPGLMGTKMVERVINMRRLMPPRQDEKQSPFGKLASSPDSSGFGRNLSKKSIDMAIRHMDIRRSIPGNLRPLMTNIPASSMYSVRSRSVRSKTISVSDSPLATSSNASSEVSVNNGICLDGIELEDDIFSDRCVQSPASLRGR